MSLILIINLITPVKGIIKSHEPPEYFIKDCAKKLSREELIEVAAPLKIFYEEENSLFRMIIRNDSSCYYDQADYLLTINLNNKTYEFKSQKLPEKTLSNITAKHLEPYFLLGDYKQGLINTIKSVKATIKQDKKSPYYVPIFKEEKKVKTWQIITGIAVIILLGMVHPKKNEALKKILFKK